MKKVFTVIFTVSIGLVCFQNCAKKVESAVAGFNLVEVIPVTADAKVLGTADLTDATASTMGFIPTFSKIELNLQSDKIKQFYYIRDHTGWPQLTGETTCNVSNERVYQSLKSVLMQQQICKYESTVKPQDVDWFKCPMYIMSEADSYYFSVSIPATGTHSGANISFFSDQTSLQNADPECTRSLQVFCSSNQGELMDQLVKDMVDRFDSYTDCSVSTSLAGTQ